MSQLIIIDNNKIDNNQNMLQFSIFQDHGLVLSVLTGAEHKGFIFYFIYFLSMLINLPVIGVEVFL